MSREPVIGGAELLILCDVSRMALLSHFPIGSIDESRGRNPSYNPYHHLTGEIMKVIPQVVLFGSIYGEWRERHVIPTLTELGVTYYNPVQPDGWTHQAGDIEAEYMAGCETVVMVFNKISPTFAGLAESGWAALGCVERNQHFILQIDLDFPLSLPPALTAMNAGEELEKDLQGWATRTRYLVHKHAHEFKHPRLHLVEDVPAVAATLREIYPHKTIFA